MAASNRYTAKPDGELSTRYTAMEGGLDVVTPPAIMPDGRLTFVENYELLAKGGYKRIKGCERYDGQVSPRTTYYRAIKFVNKTGIAVVAGDLIRGITSGSYYYVALNEFVTGASSGYYVLSSITSGPLADGEDYEVNSLKVSEADGGILSDYAESPETSAQHLIDVNIYRRAAIKPPGDADGSGVIRGLHVSELSVYAIRDNALGTKAHLYIASDAGWVKQNLGSRLDFTNGGTFEAVELVGIVGDTSAATATVTRVSLSSGSFAAGDAVGSYALKNIVGTFVSETLTVNGNAAHSTTTGIKENYLRTQQAGTLKMVTYNFNGAINGARVYGTNHGSSLDDSNFAAWEWDNFIFAAIHTGASSEWSDEISAHKNHLFLGGYSSLQNSATGDPFYFGGLGSNEIALGRQITGLQVEQGGVLAIFCSNKTYILHGSLFSGAGADSRLDIINDEEGAQENTLVRMAGRSHFKTGSGLNQLQAVQEFGSFRTGLYSQLIAPLVSTVAENILVACAAVLRQENKIYFFGVRTIIATFDGDQFAGFSIAAYKHDDGDNMSLTTVKHSINQFGQEVFYGITLSVDSVGDYQVYELNNGNDFDGYPITATMDIAHKDMGNPTMEEHYKKITIDVEGSPTTDISFSTRFDYGLTSDAPAGITHTRTIMTTGEDYTPYKVNYTNKSMARLEANIDGVARNLQTTITSTSSVDEPYTVFGIAYQYISRKLRR